MLQKDGKIKKKQDLMEDGKQQLQENIIKIYWKHFIFG